MPLDGTTFDTSTIRRHRLVDALRNDTEWSWNFCCSSGCAIGMAEMLWPELKGRGHTVLAEFIGITPAAAHDIFGYINAGGNKHRGMPTEWCDFYGMSRPEVTPQMVADALEQSG